MKKVFIVIHCVIISLQCCGQSQIQDKKFANFVNNFTELQLKIFPFSCKPRPGTYRYFVGEPSKKISLGEAKKYLSYSDKDFFVTEYDYDMDDDKISNIRQIENPPVADNKITQNNYVALIYFQLNEIDLDADTIVETLKTFTLNGNPIDKIVIQGHYDREFDWRDVVFLRNNTLQIFDYKPNMENYNIKDGAYYIIDEKMPRTIVEINDYQIDEKGKINHVKTHPKQYLKEFVSFYREYHKDSDDPMNEYEKS